MATEQPIQQAEARWHELWKGLGALPRSEAFDQLVAAYSGPSRHYHTFDHVLDCLELLDRFSHLASRPAEVEVALWFHDAVYDTHRTDNEERSADWASRVMAAAGIESDSVERVRQMILASSHRGPPATRDEALMLDIDLSVLGRARADFAKYEDRIRREFDWVADEAFRSGRAAVLTSFSSRPQIFHTRELRARYEHAARSNLDFALRRSPGFVEADAPRALMPAGRVPRARVDRKPRNAHAGYSSREGSS